KAGCENRLPGFVGDFRRSARGHDICASRWRAHRRVPRYPGRCRGYQFDRTYSSGDLEVGAALCTACRRRGQHLCARPLVPHSTCNLAESRIMADIYISYASGDSSFAHALAGALLQRDYSVEVAFDGAEVDLSTHAREAVGNASACIVVWSAA